MRCLYCGKELALLKRLTGGECCSDAHRQSYREEYNRLALTRLLQAQSKSDESKSKAFRDVPPKPAEAEPVAPQVAEAPAQPSPMWEPAKEPVPPKMEAALEPV